MEKNKNIFIVSITTICLALIYSASSYAGAGANINGCIYLKNKPTVPLRVDFKVAGTHCVNEAGHDATVTVSEAGVHCAWLGYVEGKSSSTSGDFCATDRTHWNLGYNASGGGVVYSGAADINLSHSSSNNIASFNSNTPGTSLCSKDVHCLDTEIRWDGCGTLYVVFAPSMAAAEGNTGDNL